MRKTVGSIMTLFSILIFGLTLLQDSIFTPLSILTSGTAFILFLLTIVWDHKLSEIIQISLFLVVGLIALIVNKNDSAAVVILMGGFVLMDAYGYLEKRRHLKIIFSVIAIVIFVGIISLYNTESIITIIKFILLSVFAIAIVIIAYNEKIKRYYNNLKKKDIELRALDEAHKKYEQLIKDKYKHAIKDLTNVIEDIKDMIKEGNNGTE